MGCERGEKCTGNFPAGADRAKKIPLDAADTLVLKGGLAVLALDAGFHAVEDELEGKAMSHHGLEISQIAPPGTTGFN